jgi:hypothetical protein
MLNLEYVTSAIYLFTKLHFEAHNSQESFLERREEGRKEGVNE